MATEQELWEARHAQAEAHQAGERARLNGQPADVDAYLREHPVPPVTLEDLVRFAYQLGWDGAVDALRLTADALAEVGRHDEAAALREQAERTR
jgi:hypothetical protein